MAILAMPSSDFAGGRFGLVANTQTFTSPLDKSVQTLEQTGARWRGTFELKPMKRPSAAVWMAFLTELNGKAGRFFGFDPLARLPQGSGGGDSPLVKGATQTGKSLLTDAWSATQTGLLLPGDYFEVNFELKMVTASVNSDGAGIATINFTPSLRTSPADNAVITINNPTCTMMLEEDGAANWDLGRATFFGISFIGIETFG